MNIVMDNVNIEVSRYFGRIYQEVIKQLKNTYRST